MRLVDGNVPGPWRTVVGVVPNVMQGDATRQRFLPIVYVPLAQQPSARAFVFVRSSMPPTQLAQAALAKVNKLDGDVITEDFTSLLARFAFDRDWMDLEHADLGKRAAIAPVFAVIALVVAFDRPGRGDRTFGQPAHEGDRCSHGHWRGQFRHCANDRAGRHAAGRRRA